MKLLYNTQTQKLIKWPRIDDEPVVGLAAHLLPMDLIQQDKPDYDQTTQRLEKTEIINTDTQTVTRGWNIVEIPAPKYTADEWVDMEGFNDKRPTTLLYLKLKLDTAQLTSPKLSAVQTWMDQMIASGVTSPDERRNDWPNSPYSFEEASSEALGILSEQNP